MISSPCPAFVKQFNGYSKADDTANILYFIVDRFLYKLYKEDIRLSFAERNMAFHDLSASLAEKTDTSLDFELREPPMYRVIMHNDHYTTMDFVVEVLQKVFQKSTREASTLMMQIHRSGSAQCGVFAYDIAATKTATVHRMAKERGFPLRCTIEEE